MDDRNADVREIRDRVDRVLAERRSEIWPVVRTTIAEVLGIDPSTVEPTTKPVRELTATSLDFLDLIYRLESTFDVKIPRGPIQ
ncbi:MAG: acyl carrier protein [Vicinamibacterales bacterium]